LFCLVNLFNLFIQFLKLLKNNNILPQVFLSVFYPGYQNLQSARHVSSPTRTMSSTGAIICSTISSVMLSLGPNKESYLESCSF
jgi:hypothetical protein